MAIAAGTCPNCGHAEKRVLKEGRARTIFPCPECQTGRIIARKIKMESPNGDGKKGEGNEETNQEGSKDESGEESKEEYKKEEAKGDATTKDEKTDGKPKGKVSTVRKVTYAKRESGEGASSVSGSGKSAGSTASNRSRKASGNSPRKTASATTKREPRRREPKRETVAATAPTNGDSGDSEDWRGLYPYVY